MATAICASGDVLETPFLDLLKKVFRFSERHVVEEALRKYGATTWNDFIDLSEEIIKNEEEFSSLNKSHKHKMKQLLELGQKEFTENERFETITYEMYTAFRRRKMLYGGPPGEHDQPPAEAFSPPHGNIGGTVGPVGAASTGGATPAPNKRKKTYHWMVPKGGWPLVKTLEEAAALVEEQGERKLSLQQSQTLKNGKTYYYQCPTTSCRGKIVLTKEGLFKTMVQMHPECTCEARNTRMLPKQWTVEIHKYLEQHPEKNKPGEIRDALVTILYEGGSIDQSNLEESKEKLYRLIQRTLSDRRTTRKTQQIDVN